MARSQNGYPANDVSRTRIWRIPGTVRDIRLAKGDAGFLLADFAAWFDKNIESIDHDGQLDDWGYAERPIRGSSTTLSNHASGTAIDLNAPEHPLGVRNTFTNEQERKIRAKLREYEGCIRWGGDYSGRPDEMHFEINCPIAHVRRVADKIRRGGGAATEEDDMPNKKEFQEWVRTTPIDVKVGPKNEKRQWNLETHLQHNEQEIDAVKRKLNQLLAREVKVDENVIAQAVVASLGGSADYETVKRAVKDALSEGLDDEEASS